MKHDEDQSENSIDAARLRLPSGVGVDVGREVHQVDIAVFIGVEDRYAVKRPGRELRGRQLIGPAPAFHNGRRIATRGKAPAAHGITRTTAAIRIAFRFGAEQRVAGGHRDAGRSIEAGASDVALGMTRRSAGVA